MEVVSVAEHPDAYWHSGINVQFGSQSDRRGEPFAGLVGRVYPELPNKMLFALRWGVEPSQETPHFEVAATDAPIPFELTLDESYQLTASVDSRHRDIRLSAATRRHLLPDPDFPKAVAP